MVASPDTEQDVIGVYRADTCSTIVIFYIRGGCLVDSESFLFGAEQILEDESITSFLSEFYTVREYIPREILISFPLDTEEKAVLSAFLTEKAGHKITVRIPERGDGKKLCEMALGNAEQSAKHYQMESEKSCVGASVERCCLTCGCHRMEKIWTTET